MNKDLGNTNLVVEWLFVVNKFNQDEVKDAEDIAKEIGVDVLHFVPIVDSVSASKMNNKGAEIYNKFSINHQFTPSKAIHCSWHYSRMVFNWGGKVSPCCILDDKDTDFGDLNSQNVGEIWNNTTYRETRQMFRDNAQNEHPDHICSRCTYY